ncbi:EamA family transporter [Flavobacteriaceae bacterium Ap0902]|nr:EamA family transporter [Flavobacteriaceae bacterium Ap0902]
MLGVILGDNKYILLLILALVWGSFFILIKNAVAVFTPYQVGVLRLVIKSLELSAGMFSLWSIPGMIILISTGFFHEFAGTTAQWEGLGYVSILAIVGTATAMILFYKLIQDTTAVFASTVTYLMPIVAIG